MPGNWTRDRAEGWVRSWPQARISRITYILVADWRRPSCHASRHPIIKRDASSLLIGRGWALKRQTTQSESWTHHSCRLAKLTPAMPTNRKAGWIWIFPANHRAMRKSCLLLFFNRLKCWSLFCPSNWAAEIYLFRCSFKIVAHQTIRYH